MIKPVSLLEDWLLRSHVTTGSLREIGRSQPTAATLPCLPFSSPPLELICIIYPSPTYSNTVSQVVYARHTLCLQRPCFPALPYPETACSQRPMRGGDSHPSFLLRLSFIFPPCVYLPYCLRLLCPLPSSSCFPPSIVFFCPFLPFLSPSSFSFHPFFDLALHYSLASYVCFVKWELEEILISIVGA